MARQIRVRGGEAEDLEETSAPPGTRVDVRNLFFCTPARRKFMKNTGTELGHCTDRATEFAISHPSIRFEVEHEGERMFTLPPVDTPRDRIGRFFGSDLAEKLVSFREETHFGTFHGYMGPPSLYRPNANRLYFFLNGRAIDSRDLYQSVLEAYSGMIPGRKKPVLFLFCDLDPDEVDVNVHPAKQEVRFRRRWKLRNTLTDRLRDRLESLKEPVTATGDLTETDLAPGRGPSTDAEEQQEDIRNAIESFFEDEDSDPTRTRNGSGSRGNDSPGVPTSSGYRTTDRGFLQVHDMFLVEEVEEGLLVIDQHALHERIIFHDLHHRLEKDRIPRQKLLSPAVVDVTQVEKQVIDEKQPVLQQVGLEVEPFGRGTVAVRSMPAMLDNTRPDQLLLSTIEDLREGVGETESRNRVDRLLRLISCHSAVKAGDPLQEEEIEELLIRRKEVDTAHACVHGRPTSLKLSVEDLEKRFERK